MFNIKVGKVKQTVAYLFLIFPAIQGRRNIDFYIGINSINQKI